MSICLTLSLTLTACGADELKTDDTLAAPVIVLKIDSPVMTVNGTEMPIDEQGTAPIIINDRTMLPIRFIAESFKFAVLWNEADMTVTITPENKDETPPAEQTKKSAVIYFSATGNTKALAEKIAAETNSDLIEIAPEEVYTSEDLNYNNSDCRANKEQNDDSARPAISNKIENMADYDTIYLGYPIWWGTMPKIINTFLDTYDLSGKTVMPFCTSGGRAAYLPLYPR